MDLGAPVPLMARTLPASLLVHAMVLAAAFAFLPGDAIPRDQWDSHNLIDEDVELD